MRRKKLAKWMATATAVTMLTTSVLPQNPVYAEEKFPIVEAGNEEVVEATGAENVPQVNEVVKKHTINVEPNNPESENTAGKDTYWKLVWSDEFNTGKLDTTKWDYQVGDGSAYGLSGWGNAEKQYYTDGDENGSNNISFDDEHLIITAKKENYQGSTYTSGKLWTKGDPYNSGQADEPLFSKKYGRIEAKMSLPSGTGYWPAFWMMPLDDAYGGWASSGEIDIMEARGRVTNSVDGTIHFGNTWPNNKSRGGQYDVNKTSEAAQNFDFTEEHEYALEWLPGVMKWYVDDECFYTTTNWFATSDGNAEDFTYPAPFDQEFFIMMNLAIGGNYDGGQLDDISGGQMKVDYVRVYDLCDEAGTVYDYSKDEATVTAATSSASGALLGGEVGVTNFLSGDLKKAFKATVNDTPDNQGWYLLTGTGGDGNVGASDDGAKVSITAPGSNGYSVQLSHQFPITQGYEYELTFEAKADADKSITAQVSDYVYTDFIGSWDKYTDVFSVPLTKNWQTYTYRFDMSEATDDAARLELNLGAGTTDAVYFRNASLKAIGIYEGEPEDGEKAPLSGGEHIYNGTFDQGNNKDENDKYTRMRFWNTMGSVTAAVDNQERALKLSNGTSDDAGIEQQNVQLLARDEYKIEFDAMAETNRSITLRVVGTDGRLYKEEIVALTAGDNHKECTFTVPETATVDYGSVQFIVGNGGTAVTLDNVSMKRQTNLNVDYSNIKVYPLSNGNFANGMQNWTVFNQSGVDVPTTVDNGVCTLTVQNTGADAWKQMLVSDYVQITSGLTYDLHFEIMADKADQLVTGKIETTDNSYYALCAKDVKTTTDWQSYDVTFVADRTGAMELKFILGSVTERTNVSIRNVQLCVSNTPIKQSPDMDTSGVKRRGEDLLIPLTYAADTQSDYIAAAKKVIITGPDETVQNVTPTIDAENNLVISKDVFTENGTYGIRIETEGFDFVEFDVTMYPAGENLLINGDFSDELSSWGTYFHNGDAGNMTVTPSGEAKVDYYWSESDWHLLIEQFGLPLEMNEWYELKLDARSTIDRPIQINIAQDASATPADSAFVLKTGNEYQTYTMYFQPKHVDSKLQLLLGMVSLGDLTTPSAGHSVYFDNVVLRKMSAEDMTKMVPTVVSNGSVKLGEAAVLTLSGAGEAWDDAAKTVYVNGNVVADAEVDTATVTIPASAFNQTGYYEVVIKAEGLADTNVVTQRILSPGVQNFIVNGNFAQGNTGWTEYRLNTDNGGYSYTDNAAKVGVTYTSYSEWGPAGWTTQLIQKPTDMQVGQEYKLTFKAKTSLNKGRSFFVDVKNSTVSGNSFTLTQEEQTFTVNFTPNQPNIEIGFWFGNTQEDLDLYAEGAEEAGQAVPAHTVTLSDISMILASASDAEGVVTYNIEHYVEKNGQYVLDDTTIGAAATGTDVNAAEKGLYKEYAGYVAAEDAEGSVTSGNVGTVSDSLTLKLYYKAKTYNINYVLNNDNAVNSDKNPATYAFGTGTLLQEATCEGKVFTGWYLDEECTLYVNRVAENQIGDITLYATWEDAPVEPENPGGDEGGSTENPGGDEGGSTENPGGDEGGSTENPGGDEGGSTENPGGDEGGSTENPGGDEGGSTENPGGDEGGSTENPGGDEGGSTETPGGNTGGSTETPGGNTGGSTETPGGNTGGNNGTSGGTQSGGNQNTGGQTTIAVSGVTLSHTNVTIAKGSTVTLTPIVAPATATNKTVTWSTSDASVATVANGVVTAVGKGTAVIAVTTADGAKTAICTVTVNVPATKVKLNTKKIYIVKGKSIKVKATMTPSDSSDTITWNSSKKSVATVSNGKIKAKKTGTTTITATTSGGKKVTCKVYVVKKATKATSIKLNKKKVSMKVGKSIDLVPKVKPIKSTDTIKWKSSNKKIAMVDAFGTVVAKKKGKVTITATTSSGKKVTCKVTVK